MTYICSSDTLKGMFNVHLHSEWNGSTLLKPVRSYQDSSHAIDESGDFTQGKGISNLSTVSQQINHCTRLGHPARALFINSSTLQSPNKQMQTMLYSLLWIIILIYKLKLKIHPCVMIMGCYYFI